MDLDYKYKLVEKWLQEKQNDRFRLDIMFDLELGNSKEFEAIGDSTIANKEMINILNFIFNERRLRLDAELGVKDKIRITKKDKIPRRTNIKLFQLVEAGLLKDRQKLYFYDSSPSKLKIYKDEYAIVDFNYNLYVGKRTDRSNSMLLYGDRDKGDSPSELAKKLRHKYGITTKQRESQGSIYWITENGETLDKLNEKARRMGLGL